MVLSGDAKSVKKLQEAVPILDWLKEILQENSDIVESPELVTDEVEDPAYLIPKLFCQIGDKANGWGVKPVEKMAMLLLTALDAGQGGSVTLSDKSKAKPAWFNNDAGWSKYTQPSSATLEENTDLILGIFRFHDFDPKTHNLRPLEEESDEVDGDLDEAEDEVDEGHEDASEHEEERLADSLDNVILQHVNDAMEVEIETIWSEQVQKAGELLLMDGIDCSELPIVVPQVEPQVEAQVEHQVEPEVEAQVEPASQEVEDNQKTQSFNLFRKPEKQSVVRKVARSKKAEDRISKDEEKKQKKAEKEKKSTAKRKKPEEVKNTAGNNKRKPKVTAQFIDAIEVTSEDLRKEEEVAKLREGGRPSRTRRVPSRFMSSFESMLDNNDLE